MLRLKNMKLEKNSLQTKEVGGSIGTRKSGGEMASVVGDGGVLGCIMDLKSQYEMEIHGKGLCKE